MLFQVLDAKRDCVGYFAENQINSTTDLPSEGGTWEYSSHMGEGDYEIARIYANGASITDVCPEDMKADWEEIKKITSCNLHLKRGKSNQTESYFFLGNQGVSPLHSRRFFSATKMNSS